MKITKEQYLKLYDPNTPHGEWSIIIQLINERFDEIIKSISTKFRWWDYDNCTNSGEGFFEPKHYKTDDYIVFDGDYLIPVPFDEGFPIRWLWEDFKEEFDKKVEAEKIRIQSEKERNKFNRSALKLKKQEMKKIIVSKLSKDELKYIKFK